MSEATRLKIGSVFMQYFDIVNLFLLIIKLQTMDKRNQEVGAQNYICKYEWKKFSDSVSNK